jgi:protein phosphatase
MQNEIYILNEIGNRENLEDAVSPGKTGKSPVFAVCDGVGGNNFGEVASQKAVESFYQTLSSQYINIQHLTSFKKCIGHSLFKFTTSLQDFINEHPAGKNASSTLTAVLIKNDTAYLAWCGDSRIYHFRNGEILYRTKDHSLVQELVDNNVITEKEAIHHPQKNVITKSLHARTDLEDIQLHEIKRIEPGDFFLLCTDGLLEQCTEEKLRQTIRHPAAGETRDFSSIINQICTGKTQDNYSMILVCHSANRKKRKWAFFGISLLLAGAGLFLLLNAGKSKDNTKSATGKETVTPKPKADSSLKKSNFKTGIPGHKP